MFPSHTKEEFARFGVYTLHHEQKVIKNKHHLQAKESWSQAEEYVYKNMGSENFTSVEKLNYTSSMMQCSQKQANLIAIDNKVVGQNCDGGKMLVHE